MPSVNFLTVLGDSRVVAGALDAQRRILAYDGDEIVGLAAYETLYGPRAEGVITLASGASGGLVSFLLDELLERAYGAGIATMSFAFDVPEQRGLAERLLGRRAGLRIHRDGLEIRLGSSRPSVGHLMAPAG